MYNKELKERETRTWTTTKNGKKGPDRENDRHKEKDKANEKKSSTNKYVKNENIGKTTT